MFIHVIYKDAPELSGQHIRKTNEQDISVEKMLLVNPDCPVRIMLEYIRKKCRLAVFTHFDLCDESGMLMGLFNLPTYSYATTEFEHKKTYYLIVIRSPEHDNRKMSIIPQLNHDNRLFQELKTKVRRLLLSSTTDLDTHKMHSTPGLNTPILPLAKNVGTKQVPSAKGKTSAKK